MTVEAQLQRDGSYRMVVNGGSEMAVESTFSVEGDVIHVRCNINGVISSASIIIQDNALHLFSMVGGLACSA